MCTYELTYIMLAVTLRSLFPRQSAAKRASPAYGGVVHVVLIYYSSTPMLP